MPDMIRICVLGYSKLTEIAQRVIHSLSYSDTLVEVVDSNVDTISERVREAVAHNVDVFVGGSANAAEFKRLFKGHLIEINISDMHYLSAIRAAQKKGSRIAICCYKYSRIPSIKDYRDILDVEIELLVYEDTDQLQTLIASSPAEVVIGASHSVEVAESLNRKAVLIYPGDREILGAIDKARSTAISLQSEQRLQAVSRAIVNNTSFGIIVSDESDRITLFNKTMQNLVNLTGSEARGRAMKELFPAFETAKFFASSLDRQHNNRLVEGQIVQCTQTKVYARGSPIGVLTTIGPKPGREKAADASPRHLEARHRFENFMSASPVLQIVLAEAKLYAKSDFPLIVLGEAGTERERLAQCVHNGSEFNAGPYVRVNLAAIPPTEAGRCFFGLKGEGPQEGIVKLSDSGTIVLENIGLAFPQTLACVEEYLEYHGVRKQDEADFIPVKTRVIAILTQQEHDSLSPTLMHKLGVLRILMPNFAQRREDIPDIFQRIVTENGLSRQERISPESADILRCYSWPGNIDEIRSVCRRFALALSNTTRPSAATRRLLLVEAIGEDKLFREIADIHKMKKNPTEEELPAFLEGIGVMKSILGYNNQVLANKLGMSRTSLWRLANANLSTNSAGPAEGRKARAKTIKSGG